MGEKNVFFAGWQIRAARVVSCLLAALILAAVFPGRSPAQGGGTVSSVGGSYAFIWEPEILSTVREIAKGVSLAYHGTRNRYRVFIIRSPELNAFVTPTGDIFIFSGQLTSLRCQDELAGILAHEMAHKEADHFGRMKKRSLLMSLPAIAAMILAQGEEAVITGAIAISQSYHLHYSREMEEESDVMAINALKKTAYNPLGMVGALMVIEERFRLMPRDMPENLASHPPTVIRRSSLESVLGRPLEKVEWEPVPDWKWLRLRAIAQAITSDPEMVMEHYKANREKVSTPREHQLAGIFLLKSGHYVEARKELEMALDGLQEDAEFLADLGTACYMNNDHDKAREYLEKAAGIDPERAYAHFYLAEMERRKGRLNKAFHLYRKALEGRPELPEAHFRYGMIMGDRGRAGEAAYHLGVAALLRGKFGEARSLLAQADRELGESIYWRGLIDERLAIFR